MAEGAEGAAGVEAVDWTDLEAGSVVRARPEVVCRPVEDEAVLYDPVAGRALVVNQTAATVWTVLDGDISLSGLAGEIGEAYGIDAGEVEDQLVDLARQLGRCGLLEDVRGARQPPTDPGCP